MRISIVGNGVVGGALRRWLIQNTKHEVTIYDPPQGHDAFDDSADAYFISVPVPTKGFKQDLSIVTEALSQINTDSDGLVFLRSTVLPGTCDDLMRRYGLQVHAMPEFLTERRADEDLIQQPMLIGIPQCQMDSPLKDQFMDSVCRFMREVTEDKKHINFCSNKTAEMTKYAHNVFGAVKVTYFNGIARLCDQHGVKYSNVRQLMQMSGHINDAHTHVPGPDGKKGFGGACFPKDLEAFIGFVGSYAEHYFLKDVLCLNRFYRGEKDFETGAAKNDKIFDQNTELKTDLNKGDLVGPADC